VATSALSHKVALVTGASGGIGGAIAAALGRYGATVCLTGRDRGALEAVAARSGGAAAVFPADLSRDRDIAALAERVRRNVDRLDILVHAAGLRPPATVADVRDLDAHYRVNVRAPWTLTQALLPLLRASAGDVVFATGAAGHMVSAVASAARGARVLSIDPARHLRPDDVAAVIARSLAFASR
jgi:NADP-dependent 3-hydroxy acid dehydrogenase YdfG